MSATHQVTNARSSRRARILSIFGRLVTVTVLFAAAATVRTQDANPLSAGAEGAAGVFGAAGDIEDEDAEYKLSTLRILNRAVLHIKEQYVDPKRVQPKEMLLSGLDAVEKHVAEVLVDESSAPDTVTVNVGGEARQFEIKNVDSLWEMSFKLRDIFRFIEPRLPADQDKRDVEYATINGMLATLDPHSVLLPPQTFEEMKMTTSGEFGGLGIVIGLRDGALTVISPMDGTPAAEAGLEAKDQITKIGDESTVNMALDEAVKRLRGKPGTQVTIWVHRKGWTEPKKVMITRAIIKIVNVTNKLLSDGVGYVKVKNFQQETASDVKDAINRMAAEAGQPLSGLVLDLRNNPGGLLEQAVDLSDLFLDNGVIVTTVGEGDRMREEKTARWAGTQRDLPIVVLVNGGSASASEIVAGALKNNGRGLLVGTTTFGKGSVQTLLNFKDNSALKLTIAQYLTPGDVSIQSVGITPDVEVTAATIGKDVVDLFPDVGGTREKDLDKHLDDARVQQGKAELVVRHLEDPPPEGDDMEARDLSDKFKEDFEINFARSVLTKVKGSAARSRKGLLEAASKVSATLMAEQEGKLVEALKPAGVDWSPASALEKGGDAQLTARMLAPVTAAAGDTAEMRLEVQNHGKATLYRVRANSESDNPLFQDKEFLFGKLAAGEKREWSVKVKVPRDMPSRQDEVKLVFNEAVGRVPQPLLVRTTLKELARPSFVYTALLDDQKGNGDGQLNPGETADLVVTVTNVGPGIAEEPLVLLKNLGGRELFIREGRAKLDKLLPGQSVTARVTFDAQTDVKRQVEMRLTVLDSALTEFVSEKVTLPVVDPRDAAVKVQKAAATALSDLGLLAYAAPDAPVVARLRKGTRVAVDRTVGEFVRVELGDGRFAFTPSSTVKLGSGERPKAPGNVTWMQLHRAPDLNVTVPPAGMTTMKESVSLSASVADLRGLRDAYVFANDQKVFYRSLSNAKEATNKPVQFETLVPLKPGTNVINIIARVDNEVMARRTLVIRREGGTETAARHDEEAVRRR